MLSGEMFKMENVTDYYHMLGIFTVLIGFISGFERKTFISTALTELLSGR